MSDVQQVQHTVSLRDGLDRTTIQVGICLNTIKTLEGLLVREDYYEDAETIPGQEAELEGGCPSAAAVAFIATCDRLTRLMQDDTRLTKMPEPGGALAVYTEESKARTRAAKAAEDASQETRQAAVASRTPHANLRPSLRRTPDGWAALYGDASDVDTCVIGTGATPMEALLDFDRACNIPTKKP